MAQERNSKIHFFSELLLEVDHIYLWHFDQRMELLKTSCANPEILLNMFRIEKCAEQTLQYFAQDREPMVLSDSLGLLWLADCLQQEGFPQEYYVIGPIFISSLQDQNFSTKMESAHFSNQLQREMTNQLNTIPVVNLDLLLRYGGMLHYCITGKSIEASAIRLNPNAQQHKQLLADHMIEDNIHGTWHYEQYMLKLVRDGDLSYEKKLGNITAAGKPGLMCPGNPLRQAKDEAIVATTLVARAAIEGGLVPETAYTLSDYYIQMAEAAQTINAVYAIISDMMDDFVHRVHTLKKWDGISQLSVGCMDYVDRHITEKIQIKELASSLGYADYYLTSKFKKDTGINLRDYICQKKVEQAKLLLSATQLSIQEISDRLSFSSASYFCVVFQKFAGMSPGEFRTHTSK